MSGGAVGGPYARLVAEHGLSASHRLVLDAVPRDAERVLDVGCATGYLAAELRRRGAEVVGVEFDPAAAGQARAHCAEVVVGDLESPATRDAVERAAPGGVDVVVCADVLEHLRDPWAALAWLRTLLRDEPSARAVISVPNIGHWTARRALLRGRFPYADFGLFDRTHLRFFTRASAHELAGRAGFAVVDELPVPAPLPLESHSAALGRLRGPAVARWPELLALQLVLVLRPKA
ncbi:MAG TPA: class I SAM-dependent methyltransferase [Baekduia sp.]|nr:class I SAM-dependent methyltransferase [Baekduia sp.]